MKAVTKQQLESFECLAERVGVLERLAAKLESEQDELRRRIDRDADERRELKAMTAKSAKPPKAKAKITARTWALLAVSATALLFGASIAYWLVLQQPAATSSPPPPPPFPPIPSHMQPSGE